MFFEWKSGDYTIRHMKPRYYVLKKTSLDTSSSKTLESPTMQSPTGVSQSQAGREPSVGVNRNDIVKAQREKRSGELNIVRALSSATVSWLKSGKSSDAEECDRLIDELLNQPEPRVEAYFVAAKVAELRNRPDKAISALQDVIRKHGDDKAPHLNTPAKVMGNLWIGTLYRHSGNIAQARAIYEALLTDLKAIPNRSDDELSAYVLIICNLYLAELAEATKDTDMVLERLNNIEAIKEPSVTTKPGEGQLFLNIFNIYKNWAGYQGKVKTMGKDQAVKQLTQDREEMGLMPLFALGWLKMTGITIEPQVGFYDDDARIMLDTSLERVIQDNVSDIDRALARLALGNLLVRSSEFSKAERYYSNVLESDCYFSPVAGIHLALCQTEQGKTKDAEMTLEKVNKKYPGCKAAVDEVAKHIRENKSPLTKP
jgi:tetratricopeptide (TPR) repeat protein